jgi:hypothetical protein
MMLFYNWIQTLESDARIGRGELPVHDGVSRIALRSPSRHYTFQAGFVSDAPREALASQRAQLAASSQLPRSGV